MAPAQFHALMREAVGHEVAGPLSLEDESRLTLETAQRRRQQWGPDYEKRLGKCGRPSTRSGGNCPSWPRISRTRASATP